MNKLIKNLLIKKINFILIYNFFEKVIPEKRYIKSLKSVSLSVNWFIFCPKSFLVLLSSGTQGNQMQALYVTLGNLHKITKFESKKLAFNILKYCCFQM